MSTQDLNLSEMFERNGIELPSAKEAAPLAKEDAAAIAKTTNEAMAVEKNANEVMHITNTGYGLELVPLTVLSQQVYDNIPKNGQFLSMLPGFHGSNLAVTERVPVIGDIGYFQGNTETTTGAMAIAQGTVRQPTADVTITQKELIMSVDVSRRLLTYSAIDLQALLMSKIAAAAAYTMEAMIINGDAEAGGTGNVNSDDAAPATTYASYGGANHYSLLIDHGLRELAINGTALTLNAGTLDISDFPAIMSKVGQYASDPGNCLWLFNPSTYTKALGVEDFRSQAINGRLSTVMGGALTNVFGSDVVVHRSIYKTEADGKLSATPASNTLGQIVYFYKPAVQYGYGRPLEFDVVKVPGKGYQFVATMEFGFYISQLQAGQGDSSVGAGINITVA